MMKKYLSTFQKSILAGISISIGAIAYLTMEGVIGAVLFSFGLLTCVHFGLNLYTGLSGFVYNKETIKDLGIVITGNIVGCFLTALAMKVCSPELSNITNDIIASHLNYSWYQALLLSIFCGFIMTVSVKYASKKLFLPLLFGVPLFILCGFIHSIADAFYILMLPFDYLCGNCLQILLFYLIIVVGNFIGCNLYRIIMWNLSYE